jgi:hypothetical protein
MLESARNGLSVGLFICRVLAVSVEVFLHKGMGERYLGLQAAAVLLLVPVYSLFWPGYDLRPLMLFLPAYLVMCFVARAGIAARLKRGEHCHSHYTGWPHGIKPGTKCSELTAKRVVEPAIVMMAGFLLRQFNPPLGTYLMFAAAGLLISVSASDAEQRTRSLDINDAVIDQEQVADRFREMRSERWQ